MDAGVGSYHQGHNLAILTITVYCWSVNQIIYSISPTSLMYGNWELQ